ncbi:MAG TPA: GntR family transcriptional regulator [Candidatus Barnesiella excrementipullorum]|uniref:GntR family transcriptional regulator n=1 Tax=Candidatus Barnesiella excrementipullorum TaxID=2838479 RepID=A0A9D1VQ07_9BACT|nr:GntR family transcriptional regulator [Candidatus Barnesiella excrementipullorum]
MKFRDNQSIYLQIAERICDEILDNKFPPGERIPSIREYAAMVEVNANTVVRSYEWLQQHEIIFNKRGIGYYVSPDGKNRIREMRRVRFFEDELPLFFNRLYTLGISIDEIDRRYNEYKKASLRVDDDAADKIK